MQLSASAHMTLEEKVAIVIYNLFMRQMSATICPGFSLTFEVEGHCLVSRQVPCKTEGQRPEPLGGSGACSPGKFLELKSLKSAFFCNVGKKSSFCNHSYLT